NDMAIEEGLPIEEILHADTFARDPALTWKYIAQIEEACRGGLPNAGHLLLAGWDARFDLHIVTQNVDGLHRAAGSRQVIELHGTLAELMCCACAREYMLAEIELERLPPRCAACDGLVRPNVVLFGEMLPSAALERYERELARGFDVVLAIGTTAGFPYIHMPVVEARRRGALTVEINPDETILSDAVDVRLALPAVEALQKIAARMPQSRGA
ncbi:MAG: Sir2 family NAD-dependent protein deacetylase, partial [Gammaproteobacteria bacterium]